jgi:putative oxidoreductase
MNAALLIVRLVLGLGMAAHGSQKLFGWFGGYGLEGTSGFFEGLGFRPGRFFAVSAAAVELASGLLVAFGLLGPVGPALMIVPMVVAIGAVHWKNGFFVSKNGFELGLLYALAALVLAFTGPGAVSLDALIGLSSPWTAAATWAVVALAVVAGLANLLLRRPAPAAVAAG